MLKEFRSVEISHQNKDAEDFNKDTHYKQYLNEVSFSSVYHYQNSSFFTASGGQVENSIEAECSSETKVCFFLSVALEHC